MGWHSDCIMGLRNERKEKNMNIDNGPETERFEPAFKGPSNEAYQAIQVEGIIPDAYHWIAVHPGLTGPQMPRKIRATLRFLEKLDLIYWHKEGWYARSAESLRTNCSCT